MVPAWRNYRYVRSNSRNASALRVAACFLLFLVLYHSTILFPSVTPGNLRGHPSPAAPLHTANRSLEAPPIIQKPTHGRIVVTGGGGNIGKHIVHRLLVSGHPVTVLDKIFYPDELDALPSSPYSHLSKSSHLTVHVGDIRNTTLLSHVFSQDVVGVVHLAAVSRVLWCLENEADCWDVNERGTQLVLDALTDLNRRDKGKRWFVLASSREVYGNSLNGDEKPTTEDDDRTPANVYGSSKLAAETVVTKHLAYLTAHKAPGTLRVIALRLSNVYGGIYDHLERLIPSITTQALSHQIIQISGGQQNLDLVHIDDCVEAFLLAVSRLGKIMNSWSPSVLLSQTSFETFNVASGESAKASDVISTLVHLTRSQSPIQIIPGDARFPNVYRGSTVKANTLLGFKAKVGVREGLGRFVTAYLRRTSAFLEERIKSSCGPRTASSITSTKPGELPKNVPLDKEHLDKLNGCFVHVLMNINGQFATLGPPASDASPTWTAQTNMPPWQYVTSVATSRSSDGKEATFIRIEDGDHYVVAVRNFSSVVGPTALERVAGHDIENSLDPSQPAAQQLSGDWEMRPDAESSTVRLFIPGTNRQLFPTFIGGNFTIVESDAAVGGQLSGPGPFRITPLCCPAPAPWPFVADDPMDFTIEYQRTSLERPFLVSPAKALCSRLHRALHKIKSEVASLMFKDLSYFASQYKLDFDAATSRSPSSHPTDWAKANLPSCSNLCDHPTICVDTGDCQCVLSTCLSRPRFPFSSFANLPIKSYPPSSASTPSNNTEPGNSGTKEKEIESLMDMVKRSSWRNVLRPQASRLVSVKTPLAKVHSPALSKSDQTFRDNWVDGDGKKKDIGALKEIHCMSADDQMEKAVERMHVRPEDADMTFVRHYQGRNKGDGRLDATYQHARENTPGFDPSRVIIPFTHDWGQCLAFEWNVWQLRKSVGLRVNHLVRPSTAWTVMGDLNSPCYRPHQDVVIPPRTCLSPKLWENFEDISNVKPARDRPVLAAFKGTAWGTGFLNRARLQCDRGVKWQGTVPGGRLHPDGPTLSVLWGSLGDFDYMGVLNNTIFCPQPAGTTGWSTRLADSVYAGCIPVLIGDSSHYPYFDVIDWGKISVRVDINDLTHLEEHLLSRYTLQDIEELQTNLMLVRNAFLYPLDTATPEGAQKHMLDERGPLYFALLSTKMKLLTKWPIADTYDRP